MKRLILGTMSGTSADGIDLGLIYTDGNKLLEIGKAATYQYSTSLRLKILRAMQACTAQELHILGNMISEEYIAAILAFCNSHSNKNLLKDIYAIGFHGNTIFHAPSMKYNESITIQAGNPHMLASATDINVVYDFRTNDMANGGCGAPLIPIFHQVLYKTKLSKALSEQPVVFLNVGGVSNITYIHKEELIAFDIGPGNAPMDDIMRKYFDKNYDEAGTLARQGTSCSQALMALLAHNFYTLHYPKSLDRNQLLIEHYLSHLPPKDQLATCIAWIAGSLEIALKQLPKRPELIVISGGGAKNLALLSAIRDVGNIPITGSIEAVGIEADYMEAYAFGYLAMRSLIGMPLTYPTTTGVRMPVSGGAIIRVKE